MATTTVQETSTSVKAEKEWHYPPEKDGWVIAHDAIRLDMSDLRSALQALEHYAAKGQQLQAWQVDNLQKWWNEQFIYQVHEHHAHEEDLVFPRMEERIKVPPKMSSDHKTLMDMMDACTKLINQTSANASPEDTVDLLRDTQAQFASFEAEMKEHLKEEEDIGLPMLRQNFSYKEFKPTVDKIIKSMKPLDIGWFLRPLNEEEKWAFAKQEGVPYPVVKFIFMPRVRKYDALYGKLLREIINGKQEPAPPTVLQKIINALCGKK